MKTLLLLAVIMSMGLLRTQGNLLDFRRMIGMVVGKEAVSSYGGYGCYCGYGGRGAPMDSTDQCCFKHDCCYDLLEEYGCGTKWLSYSFSKIGGFIFCEDGDFCKNMLCQCDREAAYCLKSEVHSYNKKLQYYPNWFCKGTTPKCFPSSMTI